jgi:hypothetical protein
LPVYFALGRAGDTAGFQCNILKPYLTAIPMNDVPDGPPVAPGNEAKEPSNGMCCVVYHLMGELGASSKRIAHIAPVLPAMIGRTRLRSSPTSATLALYLPPSTLSATASMPVGRE